MNKFTTLVPAEVHASAKPFKRLGVAFGKRFFVVLLIGLVWLAPAFIDHRFVYAMLAWDSLALIAWGIDLSRLPRSHLLTCRRSWLEPAALSVQSNVELAILNESSATLHAVILDNLPRQLCSLPPSVDLLVGPRTESHQTYSVLPTERGDVKVGDVYFRYQSAMRIAERWATASLAQTVRVYPNIEEAKRQTMYMARSRRLTLEKRRTRIRGMGREFESLRDYRDGDEVRDICWTASARRSKLVTRVFQIERSQTIWIVIDCGRLMRTRVGRLSKLDYAVNAALALAQVALYSGDRVGLLAYGRKIRHRVAANRGNSHLRVLIDQLAVVGEDTAEADHIRAASTLLTDQKRRCLVVWLTDLAETAITPEVMEAASKMMPRHLVLFVVIGQPDLAEMADREPSDIAQMYRSVAAQEVMQRRDLLLARLREHGSLALEVNSAALSPALVNSYLQVKERGQL